MIWRVFDGCPLFFGIGYPRIFFRNFPKVPKGPVFPLGEKMAISKGCLWKCAKASFFVSGGVWVFWLFGVVWRCGRGDFLMLGFFVLLLLMWLCLWKLEGMIAFLTLVIALIGAVIGLFGLYWQFVSRCVRLKVIPRGSRSFPEKTVSDAAISAAAAGDGPFVIDVVNLSDYPVLVVAVGIEISGRRYLPALVQGAMEGTRWSPCRINPREFQTFWPVMGSEDEEALRFARGLVRAMARTACGSKFAAVSSDLAEFVARIQGPSLRA
jgi:hypothetical protein